MPWAVATSCSMISVISFDEPYGDSGRVGAVSGTGTDSGLP